MSDNLNAFMRNYLMGIYSKNLGPEMEREAFEDAKIASELGVSSEEEFQTYFFIDHFVDLECHGICGDLSDEDKISLKKFMFEKRASVDFSKIKSYTEVIRNWAESKGIAKKAYPEAYRSNIVLKGPDMNKWKLLATEIYKILAMGKKLQYAKSVVTKGMPPLEAQDFNLWYDINYGSMKNLYAGRAMPLLKIASVFENGVNYWAIDTPRYKPEVVSDPPIPPYADMIRKEQNASDMNDVKNKMISRTFAIDKLLEKYRDVLTDQQIDEIEDSLNSLRKKIRKLKTASTIRDTVIKTANVFNKMAFVEGGALLKKFADPVAPAAQTNNSKREINRHNTDEIAISKEKTIDDLKKEDFEPILAKLHEVSVRLKRRNIVREIAGIDLDLYNLNVASFFPELTDAQAKLIEAFGYASNKIEDIIPKLRSVSTDPPLEYDISGDLGQQLEERANPPKKMNKPKPVGNIGEKPAESPAPPAPAAAPSAPAPETPKE